MVLSPPLEQDDIFNPEADEITTPEDPDVKRIELHDTTPKYLDEYLCTDIMIPRSIELVSERVIKRSQDGDVALTGCRNNNPVLDTRQYEVKL